MSDDKKLVYCRYADDFLIGISGSREDCEEIKEILREFLSTQYHLELSAEKTKITHSAERVRFLGYDVAVRRSQKIKKKANGVKQRTLNNSVELTVPLEVPVQKRHHRTKTKRRNLGGLRSKIKTSFGSGYCEQV